MRLLSWLPASVKLSPSAWLNWSLASVSICPDPGGASVTRNRYSVL
ncbi:hypothetical protein Hsar01_04129 [Haloferula sargassicola]|uniref:Uncharacterized protein n=1 Tax=Haloferula sargassicola TaxID=490096 RepID=A0ABP9UTM6_9BACT